MTGASHGPAVLPGAIALDDRIRPGDADTLYLATGQWQCTREWSSRGSAPSPLRIAANLADAGLVVWAIRDGDGALGGVVAVERVEPEVPAAALSFAVTGEPGWIDPVRLALRAVAGDAFERSPGLRKLVIEAWSDELRDGDGAGLIDGDWARPVGRLRQHGWRDPGDDPPHADLLIFEVDRAPVGGTP